MKIETRISFYRKAFSKIRAVAAVCGKSNAAGGILLSALMMVPLTSYAQRILMCKDASGRTLTSDRPMPECAGRAMRELDQNGIVRREIPAPPTAEQKRQKHLEEEKIKADEAAAVEKKYNDRAIMGSYRNEGDISLARERTINLVRDQSKWATAALAAAQMQHKDAQTEIEHLKDQKIIPPALQRKLDESDAAILNAQKKMQAQEAEIAQLNAKYDATLKRYRQLSRATATN